MSNDRGRMSEITGDVRAATAERYHQACPDNDRVFVDAVRLARSIAGTSMAALTLVGEDHLCFVAAAGIAGGKVERAGTFCERTVEAGERFIVEDALADPSFAGCDFVVSGPRMRYYAGLPCTSRDGHVIGTLCVADQRPNLALGEEQFRHLALLLEITTDRLEQCLEIAERDRALTAARDLSKALESEASSLTIEAERLASAARLHETTTDAAMQGVRQVVLLDREIHDTITGSPRRGERAGRIADLPPVVRDHLRLHNSISLSMEEEIDALVGSAASLRLRSQSLEGQGQRMLELSAVLDEVVSAYPM